MSEPTAALNAALERRYASYRNREIPVLLAEECQRFISERLGDRNAIQRLCSTDDDKYWQQLSEVLCANQLRRIGFGLEHAPEGPDLVFTTSGRRVFVEVTTPEPVDLPTSWTTHIPGVAIDFPHAEILLRWTAAIKAKAEALLGNPKKRKRGYIEKGIVGPNDSYVIAVNARLLRGFNGTFPELHGISQYPFAVEATLAVGPLQVTLDRTTLGTKEVGFQHRPVLPKPEGVKVPSDTFWDDRYNRISSIWAVDLDETTLMGQGSMAVVHNHRAVVPLAARLLPSHAEYRAVESEGCYWIDKTDGSVEPPAVLEWHS